MRSLRVWRVILVTPHDGWDYLFTCGGPFARAGDFRLRPRAVLLGREAARRHLLSGEDLSA
jgi:hypothetical protein